MRRAGLAALLLLVAGGAPAPSLTERNRAVIEDFAQLFYGRQDVRAAFEKHVALDYVQHNPGIGDGRAAAIAALEPMFGRPDARFEGKRILVDGELAAIYLHGRGDARTAGAAVADFYRLRDGKIVEHWDVIQPIVATTRNPHPYF